MRSFWNLSLLLLLFVTVPISLTGCSGQLSEEEAAAQSADEDYEGPTDDGSSVDEE
jgi:hypothetical protein